MVSFEYASDCLTYNSKSGDLIWRERPLNHFPTEQAHKAWNTRYAGEPAGWSYPGSQTSYFQLKLNNKPYLGHRICWLLHNGKWPDGEIDHIDGNGLNNSISNLRDVTRTENNQNQRKSVTNTSGVTGVSWYKQRQRWVAHISSNGKQRHLGIFTTLLDAIAARKRAERELGYHPNHGLVKNR